MIRSDDFVDILAKAAVIRTRAQLVSKPIIFLFVLMGMIFTIENTVIPLEERKTLYELFPIIVPGWIVLSLFFFPVLSYLHRMKEHMAKLALIDDLTQLPNRRAFFETVTRKIHAGSGGYLLIIDVDFFKRVNDTYGHAVGDMCLTAIAQRLKNVAGETDTYGRLGGEEFGFLLGHPNRNSLKLVADMLLEPIYVDLHPFGYEDNIALTVSIGSVDVAQSQPLERLFHRADVALYQAKRSGRAQMVSWSADLETLAPQNRRVG